jgi:hypothetical protein
MALTDPRLAANPLAVYVARTPAASRAELTETLRARVRAWTADNAHFFGPDVADRAADLIAADRIAPLTHAVTIRRDDLLAYLHLAATRLTP